MYESLYIGNREGGIINTITQADQQGDPVVVIGVGGSGVDAISKLKVKLRKQIKPDNYDEIMKNEEQEPRYDHIRFLGIDADTDWFERSSLNNDEQLNVQNPSFRSVFAPEKIPALREKKTLQWMSIDYVAAHLPADTHGAGATRQFGRWLILDKANDIRTKINTTIVNACKGLKGNKLIVHIIAGISGGMGSGGFADVCYITRYVLNNLGYSGALIYGYCILPDAVISKEEIMGNPIKVSNNEKNGLAALLEIEHLMNLKDSHERFVQDYGSFDIDTEEKLVNMCHLVSAMNTAGVLVDNAYEYSLNVIADYIIAYLSDEKVAAGDQPITMKGNQTNFESDLLMMNPEYGYSQNYVIIGSANGEIPTSQMATYLATQLFSNMTISKEMPTDLQIKEFARSLNLTDDRIRQIENKLAQKAGYQSFSEDTVKQYYDEILRHKNDNILPKALLHPVENSLERRRSQLQENRKNMQKGLVGYIPQAGASSIPGKIFANLVEMINDPTKGPIYAYGMLNKVGADLDHYLEARETYYRKNKENARNNEATFADKEPSAKRNLDNLSRNPFNYISKTDRIREYTEALNNIYHWEAEGDKYEEMEKLLSGIRQEVRRINEVYIQKLKHVIDELVATFEANSQYFALGNGNHSTDGFTKQLVSFSSIKPELDQLLSHLNKQNETKGLLNLLTSHPGIWMDNEESKLKSEISGYILNKFDDILNRSMQNYLRKEFQMQNANDQTFIDKIETQIIQKFVLDSAPHFWTDDGMINDTSLTSHRYMLSLPNSAAHIVAAGKQYRGADAKVNIRQSLINDRIYILTTISGVPIHTYKGLTNYKTTYDNYEEQGLHLYERNINWRQILTFPYPYHLVSGYTKNADELLKEYNEAVEKGVIQFNGRQAQVQIRQDLSQELLDMSQLKENGKVNINACQTKIQDLKAYKDAPVQSVKPLLSKGNKDDHKVVEDNFLRFYGIQVLVKDELEKLKTVDENIRIVEDLIAGASSEDEKYKYYFETLLTGGFVEDPTGIVYQYVHLNMQKEIILCDNSMPYFGMSNYYQGFVNFKNIDDVIYNDLKVKTNAKFQEFMKQPKTALERIDKLLNIYTPQILATISNNYASRPEQQDIDNFYQAFTQYLTNLKTQLTMFG